MSAKALRALILFGILFGIQFGILLALSVLSGSMVAEARETMPSGMVSQMHMAGCQHGAGDTPTQSHKSSDDGCCPRLACCVPCLPLAPGGAVVTVLPQEAQTLLPDLMRVLTGRVIPPLLGPPRAQSLIRLHHQADLRGYCS